MASAPTFMIIVIMQDMILYIVGILKMVIFLQDSKAEKFDKTSLNQCKNNIKYI